MSFDWHMYLELAEHLSSAAKTATSPYENEEATLSPTKPEHIEAYYRAAASKAYYSVYHKVRIHIKEKDGETFENKSGRHRELIEYLKNDRNRPGRSRVGNNLQELYDYRLKADYFDQLNIKAANLASLALAKAKKIYLDSMFFA